jgi:ABC-type lipoprotein release transport system permease subunit
MLIIDKERDIQTLSHLGASEQTIRRIFQLEGWMMSAMGAIGGMVVGLTVCLLQQHLGLLQLGNGTEYVLSAYPVAVQASDVLLVGFIVLTLGALASWIPTRKLKI